MSGNLHCPLCGHSSTGTFHRDKIREYRLCRQCGMVFVPPEFYLTAQLEKAEYDLHRNELDDPGYRKFLSRLAEPMLKKLAPASRGLDFGCGPGPALAEMFTQAGHRVSLYDVFYQPNPDALEQSYQFITATEVVEHLHRPGEVLARLWHMLEPGGYLGIMTKLVRDADAFANWHYKNDPTHVCFFSEHSWRWWAAKNCATLERMGADVMVLGKLP